MKWAIRQWFPEITLIVAVAVLFYRLLLGEVLFWGTPLLQFYPWQSMAFDAIRHGQLPLWNPLVGNGAPLLANYQTAVFYPPNWLHLVIPSEYAMGLLGIAHVIWAGLGMMAYLRRLGLGRFSQGVGGISYALSGYLIARFGFLSITSAVPWMPWLLWAVEGVLRNKQSLRSILFLSFTVAMLLLAGHAQTSAYVLTLSGAYLVFAILSRGIAADRVQVVTLVAWAGAGVVGGICLASIQLLPTLELLQTSQRVNGVTTERLFAYSFWPWRFVTLLSPNFFGTPASGTYHGYGNYWEDAAYVGLLTLVLAVRAVGNWISQRRLSASDAPLRLVPFYAGAVFVATFLALGRNFAPSQWLYERVPALAMFQAPTRWMLVAVFGMAVLGSFGADLWRTSPTRQKWSRRILVVGAAILIGSLLANRVTGGVIPSNYIIGTARLGFVTVIAAALGLALRRVEWRTSWRPAWETATLILLALDLVVAHWGLIPTIAAAYYHQTSVVADLIRPYTENGSRYVYLPEDEYRVKFSHFFSLRDFQTGDQAHWGDVRNSLLPNLGMIDGIPSASNDDPLLVGGHDSLLTSLDSLSPEDQIKALQRMNVAVLLSDTPRTDLDFLGESGGIRAYRVSASWPRVVVTDCVESPDGLQCDRIDSGSATITLSTPSQITIAANTPHDAYLLLLDTYYPGWHATVDGKENPIYLANTAFRAVPVPEGNHQILMNYQPISVAVGTSLTGISLTLCGVGWFVSGKRRIGVANEKEAAVS